MEKSNKKNAHHEKESNLKDILFNVGGSLFHSFLEQLQDRAKDKLNEIILIMKRSITVAFLVLVGLIFLLVGAANFIDAALNVNGAGLLFIGLALTATGLLINFLTKGSK